MAGKGRRERQRQRRGRRHRKGRRQTLIEWMKERRHTNFLPEHIKQHLHQAEVEAHDIVLEKKELERDMDEARENEYWAKQERIKIENKFNRISANGESIIGNIRIIQGLDYDLDDHRTAIKNQRKEIREYSAEAVKLEIAIQEDILELKEVENTTMHEERHKLMDRQEELIDQIAKIYGCAENKISNVAIPRRFEEPIAEPYEHPPISQQLKKDERELQGKIDELKRTAKFVKSRAKKIEEKQKELKQLKIDSKDCKKHIEYMEEDMRSLKPIIEKEKEKLEVLEEFFEKVSNSFGRK